MTSPAPQGMSNKLANQQLVATFVKTKLRLGWNRFPNAIDKTGLASAGPFFQ